jgi:cell division septum initiation protein DivIVA
LSSFSEKECKVVTEDSSFIENKRKLDVSLEKINNGTAKFYSIDEVDSYLDDVISKYVN